MSLQKTQDFFAEINLENGSNYKIAVLKKYQNPLLQKILKMAYDRVSYVYGVSLNSVKNFEFQGATLDRDLSEALEDLELLASRTLTGHAALKHIVTVIDSLPNFEASIIERIIDRDMRINLGTTQINKVFPGLIQKPVYMRCSAYSEKTTKKIKYPAICQKKSDGTYREFTVSGGVVQSLSRSGESYDYPVLFEQMKDLKDGIYVGELIVQASQELLDSLEDSDKVTELKVKFLENPDLILPRELGNGLINSLNPPHNNIVLELWDYITPEEYSNAHSKVKNKIQYADRFAEVRDISKDNIRTIEYRRVENIQEALKYTSEIMQAGFEGTILKNVDALFRDGTSPDQLKLKLEIEADVRITGFTAGTGKNAEYFGAITFENDEGTVKGQVGVSSMTEKLRNEIHANRDSMIGKIMEVQFNDLTRASTSETWAFSHPRFIELRTDKDEADTLGKILNTREMAMLLSQDLKMTKLKENIQVEIIKASVETLSKFNSQNPQENQLINNKLKAEMIELQELKELHPEDFL